MAKISLSKWQTEGLRCSAFLVNDSDPASENLWELLIGNPPEEKNVRPQQRLVKEEGPFLTGRLSVEARNNRIDWRFSQHPQNAPENLLGVGPYSEAYTEFRNLMERWMNICPPVNRLAYGAVLLLPTTDLQKANRQLDDLLPSVKIDSASARDFHYRINRRRPSKCSVGGLEINRLSTWSAVNISQIGIEISSGGAQRIVQSIDTSVCRLEIDINTAPEFSQNLDDKKLEILNELVGLGNEIASEGDIP